MFPNITREVVGWAILLGILLGIFIDVYNTPYVQIVHAETEPREVRLITTEEVKEREILAGDWTREKIELVIKKHFPENYDIAYRIVECESGFRMVQSHHVQPYGREESYGYFQVHARAWQGTANKLGWGDFATNPESNIKMARYIYETSGWSAWSCYSKGMI